MTMMKDKRRLVPLLIALAAAWSLAGRAQVSESLSFGKVQGGAEIKDRDLAQAQKEAIQQAFRERVRLAVSTMVSPALRAEKADVLERQVYLRSEDFITQYRITGQRLENDRVIVDLEVILDLQALRQELERLGLLRAPSGPAVFVIIEEPDPETGAMRTGWSAPPGTESDLGKCEAQVNMTLKARGFEVIEPLADNDRIEPELVLHPGENKDFVFEQLRERFAADYLVVGQLQAEIGGQDPGTGEVRYDAQIKLAVADMKRGQTLNVIKKTAQAAGDNDSASISLALNRACQAALPDVVGALTLASPPQTEARGARPLELMFENIYSYKVFEELQQYLGKAIGNAAGVRLAAFGPGWASFRVIFPGSSTQLVAALTGKAYSGFSVQLAEIKPDRIRFTVQGGPGN